MSVLSQNFARAEVANFDFDVIFHQDVFWLQVSVTDVLLVAVAQAHQNLAHVAFHCLDV